MTPKEALDRFITRDEEAVETFNAQFYDCTPPVEAQIQFILGRLNDLCILVAITVKEIAARDLIV